MISILKGHQGGVCIIMNGTPWQQTETSVWKPHGQWQPVPKQLDWKLGDNSINRHAVLS